MLTLREHRYGRAKRLGGVTNYQTDDYLQILAAVRPFIAGSYGEPPYPSPSSHHPG